MDTRHGRITIGTASTVFPFDSDDILWFGRMLREKGVDLRAQMTPALEAARDLGIGMHASKIAAQMLPKGVRVELRPPDGIDIGLAVAALSLIRSFRRAWTRQPRLFDDALQCMSGAPPLAIPQNQSQTRDHLWEIMNAAIQTQFATDVEYNIRGGGVDVKGKCGSATWEIECKVVYTSAVKGRIDRIMDGVKQIDADPSVDKGVVAVNVTNCIDHEPFRRTLVGDRSIFRSANGVVSALAAGVRRTAIETWQPSALARFHRDKFGNKRVKCRAVIYVGQTVAAGDCCLSVFTSQMSILRKPSEADDRRFANLYNQGWQSLIGP